MEIPAAVLEGGQRVLTLSGFMIAIGRARQAKGRQYYKGDVNLPVFLSAQNLKPYIPSDLAVTSNGIEFIAKNGARAYGFPAEILPKVCGVFLDARAAGVLKANQEHIADKAMILIRALASTGIIALVDEATGYQYDRPRRDLQEYLKKFMSEGLVRWAKDVPQRRGQSVGVFGSVGRRPHQRLIDELHQLTLDLLAHGSCPSVMVLGANDVAKSGSFFGRRW